MRTRRSHTEGRKMMKKVSYTLIACLLSVGLAACSSNDAKQDKQNDSAKTKETTQADQKEQQKQMEEMQKKLDAQKSMIKRSLRLSTKTKSQAVNTIALYLPFKDSFSSRARPNF